LTRRIPRERVKDNVLGKDKEVKGQKTSEPGGREWLNTKKSGARTYVGGSLEI